MSTSNQPEPIPRAGRHRLAWALFGLAAAFVTVGSMALLVRLASGSLTSSQVSSQFALLPPAAAFSTVGLVVALRRPGNAAGWLMLVIGLGWSLGVSPPTPEEGALAWLSAAGWILPFGLMGTHLLLRLPNGTLPSPRWQIVSRLSTTAMVLAAVGFLFDSGVAASPIADEWVAVLAVVGLFMMAGCILASIASLVVRSRRAGADERHQIRWIAAGGFAFFASWTLSFVASALAPGMENTIVWIVLTGYAAVPIAIGIAILKYRLYDIDVVIRKALVVAAIATFFVLVYALVVGGVGALVQSSANTALSFLAAAIVAVMFQPVLARARRFADRVVYGERATPYEVLAEFGENLADSYSADDVLPRTAHVLAEGLGAERARVWLQVEDDRRLVASWPHDADPERPDDHHAEVRHQGELLGALSVAMPTNDPMDPSKEKLMGDLAAQAGLVLRNVRLTEDLRARLTDLKAAQKRLVAAQDEERRKLERNIHDGAQQQLVALQVKLRLAQVQAEKEAAAATASSLEALGADARSALEDLRDLARGIYPPLLADKGLVAALEAQVRKTTVPTAVHGGDVGRFGQDVEAAVYFSCLEALQNVAKYAQASHAEITLADGDGSLTFSVADDGLGFDPDATGYGTGLQGMADRLGALDGSIEIRSRPGAGTTVRGVVPVTHDQPVGNR